MSSTSTAAQVPANPAPYTFTVERKLPPFSPSPLKDNPPAIDATVRIDDLVLLHLRYPSDKPEDGTFSNAVIVVDKALMQSLYGIPPETWSTNKATLFSQVAYTIDYLPSEEYAANPSRFIIQVSNPPSAGSFILENLSKMNAGVKFEQRMY